MKEPILKDLCALIRKSTLHYNECCKQNDVKLSDNFKQALGSYFRSQNYMIDFYNYTAFVTTTTGSYIYLPNQWFVVAAYGYGVYLELMKYQGYLLKVCEYMGQRPKIFIPVLRNNAGSVNRETFCEACKSVFAGKDNEDIEIATKRLWRFATDYSWWSGKKTIDRTDFYQSPVFGMLNLVAASHSFIADIINAYLKSGIASMVAELADFTETENGATYAIEDYIDPREIPVKAEIKPVSNPSCVKDTGDVIVISVHSKDKK